MLRSMNKISLKQTINHVYEIDENYQSVPNEGDLSWRDIVRKCIEIRNDRLVLNIPDLTISESQPSISFDENLFSEIETGRDATHGEFSGGNLLLDGPPVIKSPTKKRPTTLIEEVPDSPHSSSSSYSLPHASPLNSPSRSVGSHFSLHSPVPSHHSPVPSHHSPAPSSHSPALSHHSPIPSHHSPIPSHHSPVPSHHSPAPSSHSPALSPPPVHSSSAQQHTKVNGEPSSRPKRKLAGRRLQTWRGEHPIYKPTENGCFTIEGFTIPRPSDKIKRKKGKPKVCKSLKKKIDLSESLMLHSDLTRKKMEKNLKTFENLNWKKSRNSDRIEHAVITRNKENGLVVGMFRFFGKCEKPAQKTADYTTHYTLLKGLVSIKIGDEPYMILNELESLSIPGLTSYSVKNLVDGESVLQFHVVSSAL